MTRRLRTICTGLVTALALAAFVMPAVAQGSEVIIGAGGEKIKGAQSGFHKLSIGGLGILTCNTVSFESIGKVANGDKVVTLTPTYKTCAVEITTTKEIVEAEVTVNGCHYKFDEIKETGFGDREGTWDIICPTGKTIQVHVFDKFKNKMCEYTVAAQAGLKKLTVNNMGAKVIDTTFELIEAGVAYTRTVGIEEKCGKATGIAKYNGNTTLEGYTGGGVQVDLSMQGA